MSKSRLFDSPQTNPVKKAIDFEITAVELLPDRAETTPSVDRMELLSVAFDHWQHHVGVFGER